jgi:hypothetical protein
MDFGLQHLIWLLCISDLIEAQALIFLLSTKSPLAPLFQRGVIPPLDVNRDLMINVVLTLFNPPD